MERFATPYPVTFFDGDQELDKGYIGIHSALTFKRFRSLLSQKIGVSPNQLSVVFICRRVQKDVEKRQRLPINGNTNFNILLNQHNPSKERDCYFYVTVKKSKKERKGSRKRVAEDGWEFTSRRGDPFFNEERGQVSGDLSEAQLQDLASSQYSMESFVSPSFGVKAFGDGLAYGRMPFNGAPSDNRTGKILLKRSNVASVPRRGWAYGDQHVPLQGGKLFAEDEFGYMQSPRFAALPQDERPYDWAPQDSLLMDKEPFRLQVPYAFTYHASQGDGLDHHMLGAEKFGDNYSECIPQPGQSLPRTGGILRLNSSRAGLLSSRVSAIPASVPNNVSDVPHFASTWGSFFDYQNQHAAAGPPEANQDICCLVCSDCKSKNICPVPFHWCVGDAVTKGFRGPSPAGPIGRPSKSIPHVQATA